MTPAQFAAELRKRRAAINSAASDTVDVLRFEKSLDAETTLYRVQSIKEAYVSEINFLRGGSYVTASLESYRGKFLEAEQRLIEFVSRFKENSAAGSVAPGFCLGPVNIIGDFKEESASLLFRNATQKGTAFSVEIDTYQPDESVPLLKRMSGSDSLLAKFSADHKVLRERELTVAGMHAQEWLGSILLGEEQDQKKFGFALETMRSTPGKRTPRIHLSFDTGKTLPNGSVDGTVMEDKDAIAIWDLVVKSIRPAPL